MIGGNRNLEETSMKNTKRILLLTGVAASFVCAAFVTACGEEKEHTHDWGNETVVQQGSCTEDKILQYTCTVCGETKNETIAAPGHTYGEAVVVDATCVEAGSSTKTCTVCGYKDVTEIEALGHDYVYTTITEATCTENGTQKITCSRCDYEETETVAKLGHDWGEWTVVQEGDCYTDEIQERTCNRCGEVESKETAAANAHSYGDDDYCTVCGAYKYHKITVVNAEGGAVAGVTVKLATEDGIVEAQVTDENGLASFKATEDITYFVQLYDLPNGASYSKVTAASHTKEGHEFTITLGSDKVEELKYNDADGPTTSLTVKGERYYYDLTTLGDYTVIIPGEFDNNIGNVIGEIRAKLTCNYIGGAVYVLSWTDPQVTVFVSTPGKDFRSTELVKGADENGVYSMSFALAYGSTATITFSASEYDLFDYSNWTSIVTYEKCPYTYAVSLNVANSDIQQGSAEMPYLMTVGSNTVKGIKNDDGKYIAYLGLNAVQGDYTLSFTGATVQYGYSATYLSDDVTSGKAFTISYASPYIFYVVSDSEIINIDVSFAYTPGSIDKPYELSIGENTVRMSYIYLAFTPEESGKYTLRGSGSESFALYASLDDAKDYNAITHGEGLLIYQYEAGKTYYICVYSYTNTLTLSKYNAETDAGYSSDTAVAMELNKAVNVESATKYYSFTAETTGYYTLRLSDTGSVTLYSDGGFSSYLDSAYGTVYIFKVEAGGTYYLALYSYYSGVTATISAYNAETDAGYSKNMPKEITENVSVTAPYATDMYYVFTPSENGTYEFTIDNAYANIYFYSDNNYVSSVGVVSQTKNTISLNAGTTYYIYLYYYSDVTFSISKQAEIGGGDDEDEEEETTGWKLNTEYSFNLPQGKAYSMTITVSTAGDYTFTMSSTNTSADLSSYTLTVNGKEYTLSKANEAVTIALVQGSNTIQLASNTPFSFDLPVTVKITEGKVAEEEKPVLTLTNPVTVKGNSNNYNVITISVSVEAAGTYKITLDWDGISVYTKEAYDLYEDPFIDANNYEKSGTVKLNAGTTDLVILSTDTFAYELTLSLVSGGDTGNTGGGTTTNADLAVGGTYEVTADGTTIITVYVEADGTYLLTLDKSGVEVYTEGAYSSYGSPFIEEGQTSGQVTLSAGTTKLYILYNNSGSLKVTLTLTSVAKD